MSKNRFLSEELEKSTKECQARILEWSTKKQEFEDSARIVEESKSNVLLKETEINRANQTIEEL